MNMSQLDSWRLFTLEKQRRMPPLRHWTVCIQYTSSLGATNFTLGIYSFFSLGIYSKGIIWNTEIPSNTNDHNSEVYKSKNVEKTSMPYRWGWSKWRWNSIMWQKVHKFCARATGVWTLLWYKLHTLAELLHLSFSVKRPLPLEAVQMKMEIISQQGPGQPPPNKDNCLPYPLPRFISVI